MLFYICVGFIVYLVLDFLLRLPKVRGIHNKYVLITGCDSGFGNLLAKTLDKMGCHVFAACLTDKGQSDLDEHTSSRVVCFHLDVTSHQSVLDAYDMVKGKLPCGTGLWGIVNNAGIMGAIGPAEFLTMDDYHKVLNINLIGLIDVTTVFLPLIKSARGRIVNTASVAGRITVAASTPYCISKYGVESFSDALRFNLWAFKCSVHLIEPGFHKTSITDIDLNTASLKRSYAQAPKEIQEEYGQEWLEHACEIGKERSNEMTSANLMDVVNAYTHALFSIFPRDRYPVGKDAKYLFIPLSFMHSLIQDYVVRKGSQQKVLPKASIRQL